MTHKTKAAALKAARDTLGPEAIEGMDFVLTNTGAGWTHTDVPPANAPAAEAQAARVKAKDVAGHEVEVDLASPLLVDGVLYPNKTRATEARRISKARAEQPVAGETLTITQKDVWEGRKAQALKHGPRKDAAEKPPKAKAPAKVKAPSAAKPGAPEGQTKTDMILGMLNTAGGATSAEMEAKTGWAPHSVRGLLGTLRKKGVNIVSRKLPKEPTIYRIVTRAAEIHRKGAEPAQAPATEDVV